MNQADDLLEAGAVAKRTAALLRETRSLQRRAAKLMAATAGGDSTTTGLLAEAEASIRRVVDHLVRLEHSQQRRARDAVRRHR